MSVDHNARTVRPEVASEVIEGLRASVLGTVIAPGDPGYDDARRVWNGIIDRYPALIVRCAGVSDVVEAVRFAREHPMPLSIRGGGHQVAGSAVCDDGLVIDLSTMNGVHVDPVARTARVQAGARWAHVDRATQLFGLATPGGQVSRTGVAGLTLGGGMGSRSAPSAWRATTCARSRSSPPTASCAPPAPTSTRTSSGPPAAAAVASAWSPRSSSTSIRSGRMSPSPRSPTRSRTPSHASRAWRDLALAAPETVTP